MLLAANASMFDVDIADLLRHCPTISLRNPQRKLNQRSTALHLHPK